MRRFRLLTLSGVIAHVPKPKRRGECTTLECAAFGLAMLGLSAVLRPIPRLVWNASASAPTGLYGVVSHAPITRGELVLAKLPLAARTLAAARDYLPAGTPIAKHVAALAGDTVCSRGRVITINGHPVAKRLLADTRGRKLPAWHGCQTLRRGQVFLLNAAVPDSFDSRYFGPVTRRAIIGRLVAIWTR
ncbi:MAG TPA: S26 family signal peptidase [Stellaceae bacterium]|nr:S26 family signal peptidase [Stellaceae bacterium]